MLGVSPGVVLGSFCFPRLIAFLLSYHEFKRSDRRLCIILFGVLNVCCCPGGIYQCGGLQPLISHSHI